MDYLSLSFFLFPVSLIFFYSIFRAALRPPTLNIVDPTVAMDGVRDHISLKLEMLFQERYGENFVLPDGLSFQALGEHIYSEVSSLTGLQDILVNLLHQGVESPFFLAAHLYFLQFQ